MAKMFQQSDYVEGVSRERHSTHLGISSEANNPEEYYTEKVVNGIRGTRLPVSQEHGGAVPGKPYGLVNVGRSFVGLDERGVDIEDLPGDFCSKVMGLDAPEEKPVSKKPAKKSARKTPRRIVREKSEEEEPGDEEPAYEEPVEDFPKSEPMCTSSVKVTLKGSFGKYRGEYLSVHREDEFLVLVYPEDASVFSPPPDLRESLTVTCGNEVHEVYYPGIEFSLPAYGIGVQLMVFRKAE